MYKKILIPTDGSARSNLAVEEGIQLAEKLGAEVTVLHVVEIPLHMTPYFGPVGSLESIAEELEKNGEQVLQRVKETYADTGVSIETKLIRGNPGYEICNEAREGRYDLIVMANRGLGEIKGYLMGSVSSRVARHAGCSVLIVK